jgi:hypothetical protein
MAPLAGVRLTLRRRPTAEVTHAPPEGSADEHRDDAEQKSSVLPVDPFTMPRKSISSSSDGSLGVPPWSIKTSNRIWPGFLAMALPSGPYTTKFPVPKTRTVSVPSPLSVTRRSLKMSCSAAVIVMPLSRLVNTEAKRTCSRP